MEIIRVVITYGAILMNHWDNANSLPWHFFWPASGILYEWKLISIPFILRSEMIMAFTALVNAVMSIVVLNGFLLRLCSTDDACNLKVLLLERNDLVHNWQWALSILFITNRFADGNLFSQSALDVSYHWRHSARPLQILDLNISDVVETATSTKIPRPRLETSKFVHFADIFLNAVITFKSNFFQISGIFPTCSGCFLPANTTNKKSMD